MLFFNNISMLNINMWHPENENVILYFFLTDENDIFPLSIQIYIEISCIYPSQKKR